MQNSKLAFFAAAATLTFAGAAMAQSTTGMPTPGQQTPPSASPLATPSLPSNPSVPLADTMAPAQTTPTESTTSTNTTSTTSAQPSADMSAAPASATVGGDFKVGTEVKDPAGLSLGTISGTSTAADGSVNVVVTNGATKFALPSASMSTTAGVLSTTATIAQIDATLAGVKPQ